MDDNEKTAMKGFAIDWIKRNLKKYYFSNKDLRLKIGRVDDFTSSGDKEQCYDQFFERFDNDFCGCMYHIKKEEGTSNDKIIPLKLDGCFVQYEKDLYVPLAVYRSVINKENGIVISDWVDLIVKLNNKASYTEKYGAAVRTLIGGNLADINKIENHKSVCTDYLGKVRGFCKKKYMSWLVTGLEGAIVILAIPAAISGILMITRVIEYTAVKIALTILLLLLGACALLVVLHFISKAKETCRNVKWCQRINGISEENAKKELVSFLKPRRNLIENLIKNWKEERCSLYDIKKNIEQPKERENQIPRFLERAKSFWKKNKKKALVLAGYFILAFVLIKPDNRWLVEGRAEDYAAFPPQTHSFAVSKKVENVIGKGGELKKSLEAKKKEGEIAKGTETEELLEKEPAFSHFLISADEVNVREGPSEISKILYTLKKGMAIYPDGAFNNEIREDTAIIIGSAGDSSGLWYHICMYNGKEGWINRKALKKCFINETNIILSETVTKERKKTRALQVRDGYIESFLKLPYDNIKAGETLELTLENETKIDKLIFYNGNYNKDAYESCGKINRISIGFDDGTSVEIPIDTDYNVEGQIIPIAGKVSKKLTITILDIREGESDQEDIRKAGFVSEVIVLGEELLY